MDILVVAAALVYLVDTIRRKEPLTMVIAIVGIVLFVLMRAHVVTLAL